MKTLLAQKLILILVICFVEIETAFEIWKLHYVNRSTSAVPSVYEIDSIPTKDSSFIKVNSLHVLLWRSWQNRWSSIQAVINISVINFFLQYNFTLIYGDTLINFIQCVFFLVVTRRDKHTNEANWYVERHIWIAWLSSLSQRCTL